MRFWGWGCSQGGFTKIRSRLRRRSRSRERRKERMEYHCCQAVTLPSSRYAWSLDLFFSFCSNLRPRAGLPRWLVAERMVQGSTLSHECFKPLPTPVPARAPQSLSPIKLLLSSLALTPPQRAPSSAARRVLRGDRVRRLPVLPGAECLAGARRSMAWHQCRHARRRTVCWTMYSELKCDYIFWTALWSVH